jgi:hypothetical protein
VKISAFTFLLSILASAVAAPSYAEDWKVVGEQDGIEISRRDLPGEKIVTMKGVGMIDAPLWKIASILLDTARAPEWVDSLKESRVVRRLGPNDYIEYNHVGMPFIVKDREFVSDVRINVDPDARHFALVYRPTQDPGVPPVHGVRGEIVAGRFEAVSVERGRRTELTAELQCDPKGLLPGWLVNLFQRNWPLTTFEAMRRQAQKPDIVMPAEFKDVLEITRGF